MTPEERKSASNGIWLCQNHAKLVDTKDPMFTVDLLREWKAQAQKDSWHRVRYKDVPDGDRVQQWAEDDLTARLRAATAADLDNFRRSDTWPATAISRTLRVDGLDEPLNTSRVAKALSTLDDLIIVAEPGMGKTTTLFQIAEVVLENGCGSPIIVPLGDWSANDSSLLESISKRASFRDISEGEFHTVAATPGVLLLLDGWNELDSASRRRAEVELRRLEMELPHLSLLVATRKQALDVPIDGTRVTLQPLSDTEQLEIARALRGEAGERLVDEAWRTAGLRELVPIPLYLTALLDLPEGRPFPTTKEEVLRQFVAVHEEDYQKAEALGQVTHGEHQRYLASIGAIATHAANTIVVEATARSTISDTGEALVAEGQIAAKSEPHEVLEAFVRHHVLIHVDEPAGYSFQHQQFQEWYASHFVEQLMRESVCNDRSRDTLKVDVLDQRAWEEPILFACERLARGDEAQQEACGAAILTAFCVDPILTAEMIDRSTDAVWQRVGPSVLDFVERWHAPGKVDRAVCFMITSGREEFLEYIWPLITHEDDQIHLTALRAGRRFRPSLLGNQGADRIATLPPELRQHVLGEIADNSGMDGLDLVATVARADPVAEVKASVVEALAFRRADRHVVDVLQDAADDIFDRLVPGGLIDHVVEASVKARLAAARERRRMQGIPAHERIFSLLHEPGGDDKEAELATAIAEIDIKDRNDGVAGLIHKAKKQFPRAVAEGVLQRVREGRVLPLQATELMAGMDLALEEEALLEISLAEDHRDYRADVTASVLGPQAVGRLIDRMLELAERVRDKNGKHDEVAGNRHRAIQGRVGFAQTDYVLAAIATREKQANNQRLSEFADLICRHQDGPHRQGQPFAAAAQAKIVEFVGNWGIRLLASPDTTRAQLASIAALASHAPSAQLLPILERLLGEELRRWRAFREQARADVYREGDAKNEASMSWTNWYQGAFLAIRCPETRTLMEKYLLDKEFGQPAASVLTEQWRAANEPSDDRLWGNSPDLSRIAEKRAARNDQPDASSEEADAIFWAVERLVVEDGTDEAKKHAVALAVVAAALPHGERDGLVNELLQMADREPRRALLTNLALSGEMVDVELVKQGINKLLEAVETHPWILGEGYELREWLILLPLTNRPSEAIDIVCALPRDHRVLRALEAMVEALTHIPGDEAEDVLFQIAENEPHLYARRAWRDAVCYRGTHSAAARLVELTAQGVLDRDDNGDRGDMSRRFANLMDQHPDLRRFVYEVLEREPPPPGLPVLAEAVAENPDADDLVLLVQLAIKHKRIFASWMTIERAVTEQVPSETWKGSYHVVPIPAVDLRQKLMAMTTDGGPNDTAARYLIKIDKIRNTYGAPESEPRHPDIASGKAWPILV